MENKDPSREDLLKEVEEFRRRVAELDALEDYRKQTERELQNSEEKARTILENIEDGYYEVDLTGKILFCNEAYAKIVGIPKEKLIGKIYKEFGDQDPRKTYQTFNTVYRSGIPVKSAKRTLVSKDGSMRDRESSISLIKDEKGQPTGFRGITRDITERNRMDMELKSMVSLLEATIEATTDGILVVDQHGQMILFNQKFIKLWGIPDSVAKTRDDKQALGYVLDQIKDPDGFLEKVNELYTHPEEESFDTLEFKDGRIFERYSKPQRIDGASIGRVWSFRDVTQRKLDEETLRDLSLRDDLTGLFNRRGFLTLAGQELKVAHRMNRGLILLFADLDYFKEINDRYGHSEGDQALMAVTEVFKATYREPDILARIGGDEFVALVIEGASESSPENLCLRLTENLWHYNNRRKRPYILSLSIGAARYKPDQSMDIEKLIAEADKRMYENKSRKRFNTLDQIQNNNSLGHDE